MEDSSLIRRLCGLYAAMLYAYPREFRLQYGGEMQRTFRDLARRNTQSWFRFGLRNLADWIVSTMRERREARKASGTRKLVQEWAVTILLFLFVSTTMVQAYVVPTGSMENNI